MAFCIAQGFFDRENKITKRKNAKERRQQPEGDDQVPEHAVLAVESAEIDAEEFEALEGMVPVFADLAAEGERIGVSHDPIARRRGADVDAVGDFEAGTGDMVAAIPED